MVKQDIPNIDIVLLVPFEDHPFKERSGIEKEELKASIKGYGVLEPIITRPLSDGRYEIISGHRRVETCKELGIKTIPSIIKDLSKEEAIIMMVDSNIHRDHLLPSERAFAYKMKLEAMKHQGKRSDLTSDQVGQKSTSIQKIADLSSDSKTQVQRYIRLTYLIPELLKLVDEERMAMTPAVEISYLSSNEQKILYEQIQYTDATPSLSQAQRLRRLSSENKLNIDDIFNILSEEKANQREVLRLRTEDIRKYFPKDYTYFDMRKKIIDLLEKWQRQRDRDRGGR